MDFLNTKSYVKCSVVTSELFLKKQEEMLFNRALQLLPTATYQITCFVYLECLGPNCCLRQKREKEYLIDTRIEK